VSWDGFVRIWFGGFGILLLVAGIHKHTLLSAPFNSSGTKPKYYPSKGQRISMVIGGALLLYMAATNQM
jgi:hypothetical protein